jgi:membrane-bound ClpP family serine protease
MVAKAFRFLVVLASAALLCVLLVRYVVNDPVNMLTHGVGMGVGFLRDPIPSSLFSLILLLVFHSIKPNHGLFSKTSVLTLIFSAITIYFESLLLGFLLESAAISPALLVFIYCIMAIVTVGFINIQISDYIDELDNAGELPTLSDGALSDYPASAERDIAPGRTGKITLGNRSYAAKNVGEIAIRDGENVTVVGSDRLILQVKRDC